VSYFCWHYTLEFKLLGWVWWILAHVLVYPTFCGFATIDVAFCWVYGLTPRISGFFFGFIGHGWWNLAHARVYWIFIFFIFFIFFGWLWWILTHVGIY
jgi:hypothetical protein